MSEDAKLENFEMAFRNGTAGCQRVCHCGITYFDDANRIYSWEEGELEALQRAAGDPKGKTVALNYAPGDIGFEGREYVDACSCWHKRAKQLINFIDGHSLKIAEYLSLEKKRKRDEADTSPTVEG